MGKLPQIEIFCGTGGVGKTTLSAARTHFWAQQHHRVLLITIDPAHRLKQFFQLNENHIGIVKEVEISSTAKFSVLLMSPPHTFANLIQNNSLPGHSPTASNYILKILSRPHAGLNEILAVVEIQHQMQSQLWDVIVIDTPPGKSFLDFLDSSVKIKNFFDQSYIDIFKILQLHQKANTSAKQLFGGLLQSGINKLLSYLGKVTGDYFISNLIDAIVLVYSKKDIFMATLAFQQQLKKSPLNRWFLVTAADQSKISQMCQMENTFAQQLLTPPVIVLNKCLEEQLLSWHPDPTAQKPLFALKNAMLMQEKKIKAELQKCVTYTILEFADLPNSIPHVQIQELAQQWRYHHTNCYLASCPTAAGNVASDF